MHSDSRSRLADSELSAAALDRVARQAAALALPDEADGQPSPSPPAAAVAGAAEGGGEAGKPPAVPGKQLSRDITLSYPRGEGSSLPGEPGSEGAASTVAAAERGGGLQPTDSLTFKPTASGSAQAPPEAAVGPLGGHPALAPSVAGSDVATRGSAHQRTASVGSVGGAQRPVHYKSLSADSTRGGWCWWGCLAFCRNICLNGSPALPVATVVVNSGRLPCPPLAALAPPICLPQPAARRGAPPPRAPRLPPSRRSAPQSRCWPSGCTSLTTAVASPQVMHCPALCHTASQSDSCGPAKSSGAFQLPRPLPLPLCLCSGACQHPQRHSRAAAAVHEP